MNLPKQLVLGISNLVQACKRSWTIFVATVKLTTLLERTIAAVLILIAVGLITYKYEHRYLVNTVTVPASGGEYVEDDIGELKYINPALAQTDLEKSVAKLLFSGLVKVENQNKVVPDLAEKWEVSADGLTYTFHLRKGLFFSDGKSLTSTDIGYTVSYIKNPDTLSPLSKIFENVTISTPDIQTVVFTLPKPYGPFIYLCNFGILPSYLTTDDFTRQFTGSGPYKFSESTKDGTHISEISLSANDNYYLAKPYIRSMKINIFSDETVAKDDYENNRTVDALFGVSSSVGKKESYISARRLGLIFNLRSDKLKDKIVRANILAGTHLDKPLQLKLITLDSPATSQKADELKQRFTKANISLDLEKLSSAKFQDALTARQYDLLLYGFDFGFDRDPYKFWHSSQLGAQNYAGWSDKNSDILLEDARMILDPAARNAKYDQFFDILKNESLAEYYDPIQFDFEIKDRIKGVSAIQGNQVYSRFMTENLWYVDEGRVKK